MSDRRIIVSVAVERNAAEKLRKDKKDATKDKDQSSGRNLWLAREGRKCWEWLHFDPEKAAMVCLFSFSLVIRQGSKLAEGLTKADLDKRLNVRPSSLHSLSHGANIF